MLIISVKRDTEQFQSTLPTRGETRLFYRANAGRNISIHSPHTGRDSTPSTAPVSPRDFNPLSPHGERPLHVAGERYAGHISIHSPHTGRDQAALELLGVETISIHSPHTGRDPPQRGGNARPHSDFNPLSPHGERHMRTKTAKSREKFQSTLPTRGETLFLPPGYVYGFHFNPLSPHGERPGRDGKLGAYAGRFQSTLPTWGETPAAPSPATAI